MGGLRRISSTFANPGGISNSPGSSGAAESSATSSSDVEVVSLVTPSGRTRTWRVVVVKERANPVSCSPTNRTDGTSAGCPFFMVVAKPNVRRALGEQESATGRSAYQPSFTVSCSGSFDPFSRVCFSVVTTCLASYPNSFFRSPVSTVVTSTRTVGAGFAAVAAYFAASARRSSSEGNFGIGCESYCLSSRFNSIICPVSQRVMSAKGGP